LALSLATVDPGFRLKPITLKSAVVAVLDLATSRVRQPLHRFQVDQQLVVFLSRPPVPTLKIG
jgi:hypothetical protein